MFKALRPHDGNVTSFNKVFKSIKTASNTARQAERERTTVRFKSYGTILSMFLKCIRNLLYQNGVYGFNNRNKHFWSAMLQLSSVAKNLPPVEEYESDNGLDEAQLKHMRDLQTILNPIVHKD
jgi:hypothetical protein